MREKDYLKSVWLQLKAKGLVDVPHYEDGLFPRFAERHGFSAVSPRRQARIDAILAGYAEKALWADMPDAQIFQFPVEPVAELFDLSFERLKRQAGGLL